MWTDRKGSEILIIIYGAESILFFFFSFFDPEHNPASTWTSVQDTVLSGAVIPLALLLISARGAA